MREVILQFVANLGRRLTEWAERQMEVYVNPRPLDEVVAESWEGRSLRRKA